MWPADLSAHPFYYPAILTDVSPHRPQSVRPCHIFPAFSPRQPPASSIPPRIPAQHHLRIRLTRSRTATASTVRCMPGCPHLHVAAFIAARKHCCPFQMSSGELRRAPFPPFQQHQRWPRPCRPIRLHTQSTRQIRLHQYALLTRYFKISALFLHFLPMAAYGTAWGHGLPAMYERLRKNKTCSPPQPQTGAIYCPCGPANTASSRIASV